MTRFFVDPKNISESENLITIKGDDVNHIKNVLRAIPGDNITVCDGNGIDYTSVIDYIDRDKVLLNITSKSSCNTESYYKATLYQGIAKGERMDILIQKCVELGIYSIVPVICDRTIVKFNDEKDRTHKMIRWQRIALEAAKQTGRGIIPKIALPVNFKDVLTSTEPAHLKFIPYEEEKQTSLKDIISKSTDLIFNISFFIGPEGGFNTSEIQLAVENGYTPITLGKRILRTETAGPAVLSMLSYALET